MKNKTICFKSNFAILILLLAANVCIAQQQTSDKKAEIVIYKFAKSDYENNGKALQQSISQINGIAVSKYCDVYNKIFMILQVNRTLQPNDDNIVIAMNSVNIGYKKIKSTDVSKIINACN